MLKKIIALVVTTMIPIIVIIVILLTAVMIVLDFFGTNTTDGYVQDNMAYASEYKKVLNENIDNGYVSLERILFFYLARDGYSFSKLYQDNLDYESKRMKPISEVCSEMEYKFLSICSVNEINLSNQIDEYQNKPFVKPLDFSKVKISSFFMEQRIVFGNYSVHKAWDLATPAETDVYSVCDGEIQKVSFPYSTNEKDISGGGGNQIELKCNVDDMTYKVTYAHLYPNSAKVGVGDIVTKGQIIAGVGTTGYSTGNHLHYQVQKEDGTYVDGMSLIEFGTEELDSEINSGYYDNPILKPNFGY